MATDHYDVIIIGTGAGGGTLAYRLAPSGKRILILERGAYLSREKANWSAKEVYQNERYHTTEMWFDKEHKPFRPQTGYWVGGNTKVYGAALLRLREKDFETVVHEGGISPAWPLTYADFAPYYDQAEALYHVHGNRGEDPTEPATAGGFPHPAVSYEPRMAQIADGLTQQGLHPFHLPLGIKLNEVDRALSSCIRCDTCDGFPCLVQAKADAEMDGMRPALQHANVTLKTEAQVLRLLTSPSGRVVTGVEVLETAGTTTYSAAIVVVACGAINSAALLLKSANDRHPHGLANSSDQVGRHFMKHLTTALVALTTTPNPAVYQKTIAVSDFYWGAPDFPYPLGLVQNTGNVLKDMLPAEAPALLAPLVKLAPGIILEEIAQFTTGWWMQTEDLPDPANRVYWRDDQLHLDYTPNNTKARDLLLQRWIEILKRLDQAEHLLPFGIYPRTLIPLQAVGHQCGTCRFGVDPATSVLDLHCRTHDLDNLYVVDGSFFPSSAAVNPTLTIIANALRVGDHLLERLT
ncbi:GMC oxidoreductase [Anthocerotibacter panamensis]|uniref:GMC oxidoreductase n=1 Tax=Anthocerotibacter panamensis TaxID=2857077 RepID=UPI001C40449B|nr:GMC family oxidoreductase [Anthocerotibacter panamensis]